MPTWTDLRARWRAFAWGRWRNVLDMAFTLVVVVPVWSLTDDTPAGAWWRLGAVAAAGAVLFALGRGRIGPEG